MHLLNAREKLSADRASFVRDIQHQLNIIQLKSRFSIKTKENRDFFIAAFNFLERLMNGHLINVKRPSLQHLKRSVYLLES